MLDLGTWPGLLALLLAQARRAATAVDPVPETQEALNKAAIPANLAASTCDGNSCHRTVGFRLVPIGRAFHGMDWAASAEALDRLVVLGGVLALFEDETLKTVKNR